MIHKLSEACAKYIKLCEQPVENKKLDLLYQVLAELNYYCLLLEIDNYENRDVDAEIDDVIRIPDNQSRPFISKHYPELGFYWSVMNPNDVLSDVEIGTGDAIDDLVDIYADLKEGYQHYENGNLNEAAFVWKNGYEIHWRQHLVELQCCLHDLIY